MPYVPKYLKRYRRRKKAAGSIQKAWKRRKQRKIGLVQRTLMANRNNLKRLKKTITTQIMDDEQALPANAFDGQYNDSLVVDNDGVESTSALPYSPSLLRLPYAIPDGRKDPWITMRSLTMKYCITAGDRWVNQRVTLMLVLDTSPQDSTNVALSDVLTFTGATVGPPANKFDLAYQNLDNCGGPKCRFKILWRKVHMVTTNNVIDTATVPAITQAAAGVVMRPEYENAQWRSRSYPGRQYGSVTIKRNYKLNYGVTAAGKTPENQTVRLFAFSTAEGSAGGAGAVIQYYCRFRYKDL